MKRLPLLLLALAAAPAARAAPPHWVATAPSSIHWTAQWQGTPVKGGFPDFTVQGAFDAAAPAGGTIEVRIDTTAVKSASGDVTRAIRGPRWFDTADHPRASFHGTFGDKGGKLSLHGTLQIKGHRKDVTFPVTVSPQGDGKVALSGNVTLQRGDFDIGSGQWSSGAMIARGVEVDFSVTLRRQD